MSANIVLDLKGFPVKFTYDGVPPPRFYHFIHCRDGNYKLTFEYLKKVSIRKRLFYSYNLVSIDVL